MPSWATDVCGWKISNLDNTAIYEEPKPKVISYLIILFMFCEPQIIVTLRRLVKINSICKCCNISVNKTIDAQVQAFLSVICAARFHAHVSLAGKERVTLSWRNQPIENVRRAITLISTHEETHIQHTELTTIFFKPVI